MRSKRSVVWWSLAAGLGLGLVYPAINRFFACEAPMSEACIWGKAFFPLTLVVSVVVLGGIVAVVTYAVLTRLESRYDGGVIVRPVEPADGATWTALRHRLWPHTTVEHLVGTVEAFFGAGTPEVAAAFLAWDGASALGVVKVSVRSQFPGARSLSAPVLEGWYVVDRGARLSSDRIRRGPGEPGRRDGPRRPGVSRGRCRTVLPQGPPELRGETDGW